MALRTSVLAGEINNLSDARYFAAYPVKWMSFVCNPNSSSYLPAEKITEILNWISGPEVVLDVRGCNTEQIESLAEEIKVTGLIADLSQDISVELGEHYSIFRMVDVASSDATSSVIDALATAPPSEGFILDFLTNDVEAATIFLDEFHYVLNNYPVLLQANFNVKDISRLLEMNLNGLSILGGNEEKVGIRSFDDVQDLMEELEEWE